MAVASINNGHLGVPIVYLDPVQQRSAGRPTRVCRTAGRLARRLASS